MCWYKTALRKHVLRFDPRVMVENMPGGAQAVPSLMAFITSAVVKGLDIVGLVSVDVHSVTPAKNIASNQGLDITILPGQSYVTADNFHVVIYNGQDNVQSGMMLESLLQMTSSQGLLTLVYDLGKQQAKQLYKLGKESNIHPDFVEIFSGKSHGYTYFPTTSYEVVSSGAETPYELEGNNIYSSVPRQDMEDKKVIFVDQGTDYVPPYLQQ